jgi:hypothetical protein
MTSTRVEQTLVLLFPWLARNRMTSTRVEQTLVRFVVSLVSRE